MQYRISCGSTGSVYKVTIPFVQDTRFPSCAMHSALLLSALPTVSTFSITAIVSLPSRQPSLPAVMSNNPHRSTKAGHDVVHDLRLAMPLESSLSYPQHLLMQDAGSKNKPDHIDQGLHARKHQQPSGSDASAQLTSISAVFGVNGLHNAQEDRRAHSFNAAHSQTILKPSPYKDVNHGKHKTKTASSAHSSQKVHASVGSNWSSRRSEPFFADSDLPQDNDGAEIVLEEWLNQSHHREPFNTLDKTASTKEPAKRYSM